MADNVSGGLPDIGKTRHGGTPTSISQSVSLEGTRVKFADDVKEGAAPRRKVSGRFRHAILVRNVSGVNLKPKRAVAYHPDYRKRRVNGYTSSAGQEIAGIVDPDLPATGVAPNDLFYIFVEGPCVALTVDAGAVIAQGANVQAVAGSGATNDASGRVGSLTISDGADAESNIGKAELAVTDDNEATDVYVDLKGLY